MLLLELGVDEGGEGGRSRVVVGQRRRKGKVEASLEGRMHIRLLVKKQKQNPVTLSCVITDADRRVLPAVFYLKAVAQLDGSEGVEAGGHERNIRPRGRGAQNGRKHLRDPALYLR